MEEECVRSSCSEAPTGCMYTVTYHALMLKGWVTSISTTLRAATGTGGGGGGGGGCSGALAE